MAAYDGCLLVPQRKGIQEISLALISHYKDSYLQLVIQGGVDPEVLIRVCGESESIACFEIRAKFKSIVASETGFPSCPAAGSFYLASRPELSADLTNFG